MRPAAEEADAIGEAEPRRQPLERRAVRARRRPGSGSRPGSSRQRLDRQLLALARDQRADGDEQRARRRRAPPWPRRGRPGGSGRGRRRYGGPGSSPPACRAPPCRAFSARADREQAVGRRGRPRRSARRCPAARPNRWMSLPRALTEKGTPSAAARRIAAGPSGQKNSASITSNGKRARISRSSGSSASAIAPRRPRLRRAAARPGSAGGGRSGRSSSPRSGSAAQRRIMGVERQRPERQADRRDHLDLDVRARGERRASAARRTRPASARRRSGTGSRGSARAASALAIAEPALSSAIKPRVHRAGAL